MNGQDLLERGPVFDVFRAPTDNDTSIRDVWKQCDLRHMRLVVRSLEIAEQDDMRVVTEVGAA